jgi:hypothetical protein
MKAHSKIFACAAAGEIPEFSARQTSTEHADEFHEETAPLEHIVVIRRAPMATNLGCADNALVALGRHCFYLALHSTLSRSPKLGWSGFAYIANFIHPGSMGAA